MRQPHADRYLQQLVDQGYGRTISEVADYLIARGLDDLLRAGVLKSTRLPETKLPGGL